MMNNTFGPLQVGNVGIAVNKMQGYLNIMQGRGFTKTRVKEDGKYGVDTADAVRDWQAYANLPINGKIGLDTWNSIVNQLRELGIITNIPVYSRSYYLTQGNQGLDVFKMQEYLNEIAAKNNCLRPIPLDGTFGPRTTTMVQQYQYLYDLTIDGVIGKNTWDSIINERNAL